MRTKKRGEKLADTPGTITTYTAWPSVRIATLRSQEYGIIKADYDRISREHFDKSYVPPPDMSFAKSDALFPSTELGTVLAAEFEKQCRVLCFGAFPTWDEVQARLESVRDLL